MQEHTHEASESPSIVTDEKDVVHAHESPQHPLDIEKRERRGGFVLIGCMNVLLLVTLPMTLLFFIAFLGGFFQMSKIGVNAGSLFMMAVALFLTSLGGFVIWSVGRATFLQAKEIKKSRARVDIIKANIETQAGSLSMSQDMTNQGALSTYEFAEDGALSNPSEVAFDFEEDEDEQFVHSNKQDSLYQIEK